MYACNNEMHDNVFSYEHEYYKDMDNLNLALQWENSGWERG